MFAVFPRIWELISDVVSTLLGTALSPKSDRIPKSFEKKASFYTFWAVSICGVAFEKKIIERLTEDEILIYSTLVKFHNNFKSIGNMYRKRNPKLTEEVYRLANEIKSHLLNSTE